MSAVLAEFRAGATSFAHIAERTGFDPDLVRLVVDRLVALGKLTAEEVASGCPPAGCGGCAAAAPDDSPCPTGPARSRGPVLIRLAAPPR